MANIPTEMRFYRYTVESLDILFDGEDPLSVENKMISSITVEKDFDNDYSPVLMMDGAFNDDLYYKIMDNKLTVRFRLRMQKYTYDSNNTFKFKKDIINDVFCIFMDEHTPFISKSTQEEKELISGEETTPEDVAGSTRTFFLYKESDIVGSKTIINTILSNTTMTNAVTYSFSKAGFKKVLLGPLGNGTSYSEIVIPPYPLLGVFDYLSARYGFYLRGEMIFFDFERTYFIEKTSKCTAWETGEYKKTLFNIKRSANADSLTPGSYESTDEEMFYVNILPDNIQMMSPTVITDHTIGNNLILITPSSAKVTKVETQAIRRGKGSYKVLVNKYDNQYKQYEEKNRREEAGILAQITLGDFDISALTPNKEFVITFEDTAINKVYGASYRLSSTLYTFVRQGEDFVVSGTATLKRYNG